VPLSARVELIYDATCPNVDAARQQLRDALARAGRPPIWTEWDRAAPSSPAYVRRYASPTVLVAGCDVTDAADLDAGRHRMKLSDTPCRQWLAGGAAACPAAHVDSLLTQHVATR
jgi:hypothetical protein